MIVGLTDALLKVRPAGICHSELHIAESTFQQAQSLVVGSLHVPFAPLVIAASGILVHEL